MYFDARNCFVKSCPARSPRKRWDFSWVDCACLHGPSLPAEYGSTGYGCRSCSWSAEQGKIFCSPCPRSHQIIWSREAGSAVPSRVSPLLFHLRLNLIGWCLLTGFLPLSATRFKDAVNRHRVGLEYVGSRNCVPMMLTAESTSAKSQIPQGSSIKTF